MATETSPAVVLPKWDEETEPARNRRQLPFRLILAGVLGLVLLVVLFYALRGGTTASADGREMKKSVVRGNMVIVVTEDGNVESSSNVDVKCEVAGGSTILWLVKDGTRVEEGDDLVRLDSSTIEDQVNSQKIAFAKAEAAKIEAEKTFSSAKIAVQEFIEGNYVQQIQDAEGKITFCSPWRTVQSRQVIKRQHTDRMTCKGQVDQSVQARRSAGVCGRAGEDQPDIGPYGQERAGKVYQAQDASRLGKVNADTAMRPRCGPRKRPSPWKRPASNDCKPNWRSVPSSLRTREWSSMPTKRAAAAANRPWRSKKVLACASGNRSFACPTWPTCKSKSRSTSRRSTSCDPECGLEFKFRIATFRAKLHRWPMMENRVIGSRAT